jgi:cobalt-zinc-cadmium efflux system membrane fusion protein
MSNPSTFQKRLGHLLSWALKSVRGLGAAAIIAAVLAVGYFGPHWLFDEHAGSEGPEAPAEPSSRPSREFIELTPEKEAAAKITVHSLQSQHLVNSLTVPAAVRYNASRYLELRSPLDAVVQEVLVKPTEPITAGAPLVVLTSEEMGLARRDRAQSEATLQLAQSQAEWSKNVEEGVSEIVSQLKTNNESPGPLTASTISNKRMGQFGERLLKAHSAWTLAKSNVANAAELSNVISGRELRERQAALQQAAAAFHGEAEQILFEAGQQRKADLAAVADAERKLAIAKDKIASLLGPTGLDEPESSSSRLVLTAPFAGRVEEIHLVPAERIDRSEVLLTLADPDQLWIAAEVAEQRLPQLNLEVGKEVTVRQPSQPGQSWSGRIRFVGASVDAQTRTVPVVIDLANSERKLRPGMFVWADLPFLESKDALAVPPSALARHELETFVFVEVGPRKYRRVDVEVLTETPQWTEVTGSGLTAGVKVVDGGVFSLKSELLLESDE